MSRSKKLFVGMAGIFFIIIAIIGYDMSRRTTFPGSKGNLKERMAPADQEKPDSVRNSENP